MRFKLKIVFIVFSGLLLFQEAKAQKDTLLYYLKNTGDIVAKENADYFMMIFPQDANSKVYPMLQYYMDGKRKLISATKSRKDLALDGPTLSFFPNGKRQSSVTYKNGKPTGETTEYHPNGKLYAIKNYKRPDNPLLIECRDSTGIVLAQNGNGKWLTLSNDFEKILREEIVQDGVIQNMITSFVNENIKPSSNRRMGMASITVERPISNSDSLKVETLPIYKNDINAFPKYLGEVMKYPAIDRENNVTGKLILSFAVGEDGTLSDFKILQSVSKTIDAEALKVVKETSPWKPAKIGTKAIKVDFTVGISFDLEIVEARR